MPPGWTKIAPQTEKPLGSWACTLVLSLLYTCGQCKTVMRPCASLTSGAQLSWQTQVASDGSFRSPLQAVLGPTKNTGETERKL